MRTPRLFQVGQIWQNTFTRGDLFLLGSIAVIIYFGARLAFAAPAVVTGPTISLAPAALPWYAILSILRMGAAYGLSLVFALVYGWLAAHSPRAQRILLPLLDILQSIPILSFLPVVLLSLTAVLPQGIAIELSSIILIFTSQVWNLIFAWYQALITIPKELNEASATYRFNSWMRFKTLALPFAANNLIWNSIMSWAGGWFFLMAAEIFTVGSRDFRLPGLGAYLQAAANQGDIRAIALGIATLVLVIILFDQLLWRPLLAWADRFKVEMVSSDDAPTSWFYDLLVSSHLMTLFSERVRLPLTERLDNLALQSFPLRPAVIAKRGRNWIGFIVGVLAAALLAYGLYRATGLLATLTLANWLDIGGGLLATLFHVAAALVITFLWTIPVGVLIGTNKRSAKVLQPIVQILASVPATAIFPVIVLALVRLSGGMTLAAIVLMLMGTQWYVLFNVIAGTNAIPQDIKYTTTLLQLKGWQRWRTLILPSLFPYLITGAITASGGAWNASIVAEYVVFDGKVLQTSGIGAVIARATAEGNFALLLGGTLTMIITVVCINRFLWRRLYRLAEEKYRME
ncbi:MAG: ABC transporter permease subunit [Chloroflexi bacterium]|nr:ABC transporter permease subunit [Chloroflexota bacterium]